MNNTHLFVNDYGELLAQVNGYDLVSFERDGGYQGDYCAVLTDGERLFYYIDSYGSCSGCDWLEDKGSWYQIEGELDKQRTESGKSYAVPYTDELEFCGGIKPKYIVPKDSPLKVENKGKYSSFEIAPPSHEE